MRLVDSLHPRGGFRERLVAAVGTGSHCRRRCCCNHHCHCPLLPHHCSKKKTNAPIEGETLAELISQDEGADCGQKARRQRLQGLEAAAAEQSLGTGSQPAEHWYIAGVSHSTIKWYVSAAH